MFLQTVVSSFKCINAFILKKMRNFTIVYNLNCKKNLNFQFLLACNLHDVIVNPILCIVK